MDSEVVLGISEMFTHETCQVWYREYGKYMNCVVE